MRSVEAILADLRQKASARAAFIVDDVDEVTAFEGEPGLAPEDMERLAIASLAGGADGLLRLLDQENGEGVGVLFHDHQGQDVWVSRLHADRTLVVLFAKESVPVYSIRQQIKAVRDELVGALDEDE
jgi:hypothetical protein